MTGQEALDLARANGHRLWLWSTPPDTPRSAFNSTACLSCGAQVLLYRDHCLRVWSPAVAGHCPGDQSHAAAAQQRRRDHLARLVRWLTVRLGASDGWMTYRELLAACDLAHDTADAATGPDGLPGSGDDLLAARLRRDVTAAYAAAGYTVVEQGYAVAGLLDVARTLAEKPGGRGNCATHDG